MKLKHIFYISLVLLLVSCGGSENSNICCDTPPTNKTNTLSGKVVDGELIYATVFLDLNKNYMLDSFEPKTKSDENGSYILTIDSDTLNHPNYKDSSAFIVSIGGFDKQSKKEFVGILTSPLDTNGTNNITPITTLVNQYYIEGNISLDDVKANVARQISIDTEDLMSNPIELAKSGKSELLKLSLKLQQSSEILSKNLKQTNNAIETYTLMAIEIETKNNIGLYENLISMIDKNSDKFDNNISICKAGVDRLNTNIDTLFQLNFDKFENNHTVITTISINLSITKTKIEEAIQKSDETLIKDNSWDSLYIINTPKDINIDIVKALLDSVGYNNKNEIEAIAKLDGIDSDLTLSTLNDILKSDGKYAHIVSIIDEKIKNLNQDSGTNQIDSPKVSANSTSTDRVTIKQVRKSDWHSGFCEEVEVKNISDEAIVWEVEIEVDGTINNLWSANYTQDNKKVVASGVSWNALLNSSQSTSFGYCASKDTAPSSVVNETVASDSTNLTVTKTKSSEWDSGFCENVKVTNSDTTDTKWSISTQVDGTIYNLWNAIYTQSSDGKLEARGVSWNEIVKANSSVEFGYCANKIGGSTPTTPTNPQPTDPIDPNPTTPTNPTPPISSGDFNYSAVLPLTLKFYEAQRATGAFPTVNWRKAGGLSDGTDVGRDLTGGWFDAGDHVKFNLPMSYSATMLNWGMIEFSDGYQKANQTEYAKSQVKYALDYFLQAYDEGSDAVSPSDDKVHYQVGDGGADHAFWGPPESMTMDRPTYTCTSSLMCSEVAGGMSASLASGAILFADDPIYSALLLDKAKKIYNYAETYQGNNGYTKANGFYSSYSGYNDELAWGAIWLYKATNDTAYLEKAKLYIAKASDGRYWSQSWDNVSNGVYLLLSQLTTDTSYKNSIETHLNHWINGVNTTTGGLKFLDQWGSLRYSSTTAFISLLYAKGLSDGATKESFISLAKGQIDYILGANPRNSSYIVGYGVNPPINPHHRASHNSSTNNINSPINNEFVLEGALVGGPKSADDFDYRDDRTDYISNEVATDYNAGLVGALAGLVEMTTNINLNDTQFKTIIYDEFNSEDKSIWQMANWSNGDPFYNGWCKEQITFDSGILNLKLEEKACSGETHASGEYRTLDTYKYGRYTARFQASNIDGTISSLFTYTGPSEGTDWDEIDMEILGKDTTKIQLNYWRDGKEHPKLIDLGFDASLDMHTYSFIWHESYIKWYIDDKLVHTVYENNNNDKDSLPINAGKIMLNLWAGIGIDSWSGSYIDGTVANAKYDYVKFEEFL